MTVTLAADAAATPTEAAAATEACAPMFVLLTGSQPVVISFVQQRALSHARTTPYPCALPPGPPSTPFYTTIKPLAEAAAAAAKRRFLSLFSFISRAPKVSPSPEFSPSADAPVPGNGVRLSV